jgi:hypothetical protein
MFACFELLQILLYIDVKQEKMKRQARYLCDVLTNLPIGHPTPYACDSPIYFVTDFVTLVLFYLFADHVLSFARHSLPTVFVLTMPYPSTPGLPLKRPYGCFGGGPPAGHVPAAFFYFF